LTDVSRRDYFLQHEGDYFEISKIRGKLVDWVTVSGISSQDGEEKREQL
jgi:hypothetical protein